jgi:acetate kinase
MIVATINSGSTSVKLAAYEATSLDQCVQIEHEKHTSDEGTHEEVLRAFFSKLPAQPDAVAHRVVHGGTNFKSAVIIDPKVLAIINQLSELAPLHNPTALAWIEAARSVVGQHGSQVAVFDTSFFSALPRVAAEYALPARLGVDEGVRRYGFHGLAHEAMLHRWRELHPDLQEGGRVITLQLGGGCSAAAIRGGKPLDTTMGFSPLEGLMMATRSGDVDPAVVPYLQHRQRKTSAEIIELLNREAGVAGVSGGMTDLERLAADPAPQSQFAVDLYCYRIRKCLGAYLSVLEGCDGIVFGGGVGEHVPVIRQRILGPMTWAGIEIDAAANEAAQGREARIDSGGTVRIQVIPVDEESILVKAALTLLT